MRRFNDIGTMLMRSDMKKVNGGVFCKMTVTTLAEPVMVEITGGKGNPQCAADILCGDKRSDLYNICSDIDCEGTPAC